MLTDTGAAGIRPTKDVDAIVEVTSYAMYAALSERLRAIGLTEDMSKDAPLCRWRHRDIIFDVMPTDARVLGFSNTWYVPAIRCAQTVSITGQQVRLVTPVYFIATKLEAFHGRGQDDVVMSHDLEDIVTVIDGRPEVASEIKAADPDVRNFITSEISQLLANRVFTDSLSGFVNSDRASQARRPILEARLRAIADT